MWSRRWISAWSTRKMRQRSSRSWQQRQRRDLDIWDRASIEKDRGRYARKMGRLDILVNSVGKLTGWSCCGHNSRGRHAVIDGFCPACSISASLRRARRLIPQKYGRSSTWLRNRHACDRQPGPPSYGVARRASSISLVRWVRSGHKRASTSIQFTRLHADAVDGGLFQDPEHYNKVASGVPQGTPFGGPATWLVGGVSGL